MKFSLSDSTYRKNIEILQQLTSKLKSIEKKAGTGNPKFDAAWSRLLNTLNRRSFERYMVQNRFDIRALAIALNANRELRKNIIITENLLDDVDVIAPKGSSLFIDALSQYFLTDFDSIREPEKVGRWLCEARAKVGKSLDTDENVFSSRGPNLLAKNAIKRRLSFNQQVANVGLKNYASGDFLKRALSIYFVEQLREIPVNKPHEILNEVSRPDVYKAKYDDSQLIGHVVLNILIERAPRQNVHDSWQNAVISIAGDPRVPKSHERYLTWWSHLPEEFNKKVQSWLSRLDLKLFLEALENLSTSSHDQEMMRMFPSRKHFLEGMHAAGCILHTKLYLSKKADWYIKRNYKPEHIPDYSIVEDGDRSIIYAELTNGHMVEGSHNCQIWFYKRLHESAPLLSYSRQRMSYRDLTLGLNEKMERFGCAALDHFTHSPSRFSWQRRSIKALKQMGVKIRATDVLSSDDYKQYKRFYGVE